MSIASLLKTKYIILTIFVVIIAIILKIVIKMINLPLELINEPKKEVYYGEDLRVENKLYLAVLGSIYDVTKGNKHYGKGSPYNYFIGKDGSRALVTGNFNDETEKKDHVLDLSCNDLITILQWRNTFKGKYTFVGLLVGRYYDENGAETLYMREFKKKLQHCKKEKEEATKQDQLYPPCNIAWSEDNGTRVWCTKSSGGIARNWDGVPRQFYTPGEDKPRCVCVNLKDKSTSLLKEYPGCLNTSTECTFID